jgi:hypothetical protein
MQTNMYISRVSSNNPTDTYTKNIMHISHVAADSMQCYQGLGAIPELQHAHPSPRKRQPHSNAGSYCLKWLLRASTAAAAAAARRQPAREFDWPPGISGFREWPAAGFRIAAGFTGRFRRGRLALLDATQREHQGTQGKHRGCYMLGESHVTIQK